MAITLPTPSNNSGSNDWSDVYNNDAQLVTEIDNRDSSYRTIASSDGILGSDAIAATFMLGSQQDGPSGIMARSTEDLTVGGGAGGTFTKAPSVFYFDDADYSGVTSKTQKLRVRAQILANATAPGITLTVGLYPVTIAGGADILTYTAGTVITGSAVAFVTPSASTPTQANSGDFTIPSDGAYLLAVVTSGSLANNAALSVHAQVQRRWV